MSSDTVPIFPADAHKTRKAIRKEETRLRLQIKAGREAFRELARERRVEHPAVYDRYFAYFLRMGKDLDGDVMKYSTRDLWHYLNGKAKFLQLEAMELYKARHFGLFRIVRDQTEALEWFAAEMPFIKNMSAELGQRLRALTGSEGQMTDGKEFDKFDMAAMTV